MNENVSENTERNVGKKLMSTSENTTNEIETESKNKSSRTGTVEILPSDSRNLSMIFDEESLTTEKLLDTSAERLYNLMHSQMEATEKNYLEDLPCDMKYEQVDKVCALAKELRETIKLKSDVLRLKKDIIKDLRIRR